MVACLLMFWYYRYLREDSKLCNGGCSHNHQYRKMQGLDKLIEGLERASRNVSLICGVKLSSCTSASAARNLGSLIMGPGIEFDRIRPSLSDERLFNV